ncbi:MAG: beta strand repeat-containing protein, partial [Sphingobium sp.]
MQQHQRSSIGVRAGRNVHRLRSKPHAETALLAAASSAILAIALLSPPAQASCTPAAGSDVVASCTGDSENLNGDNGYGTGTENNVTLTVDPGAIVTGDRYGLALGANARITTGAGSLVEGEEAGILAQGDDAQVAIAGRVTSGTVGVQLGSGSVTLSEGAGIDVSNATLADDDLGAGIFIGDGGKVTVDGTVNTSGRLVYGVLVERQTPGSTRATDVTVGERGSIATGGDYASAVALFGGEESGAKHIVTINGTVTTSGDHAYGVDVREVIDGSDAIRSDTTTAVHGTVRTSGKSAHGIYTSVSDGSVSPITVSNIVNATGEDAHGIVIGVASRGVGRVDIVSGGLVSAQGQGGSGIAFGPSAEIPGVGEGFVTIHEGGRVSAEHGPAIAVIDDPAMPVDSAVGRINMNVVIAGKVDVADRSNTAIRLGAGDDRVVLLPTYDVSGVIDGGDGNDVFVLDGAAGTMGEVDLVAANSARATGFESILKTGAGTWRVNGNVPGSLSLPVGTVEEGTMILNANARSLDVDVAAGATFSGHGRLRTLTVADGGIVAPGDGVGTLTVDTLRLNESSVLNFELGAPERADASDRITVHSELVLDGVLNIIDAGGIGNGVYDLIDYGLFTDNGLTLGTAPSGYDYEIDRGAGIYSKVRLAVSGGDAGMNQYWDGTNSTPGNMQYGRGGAGVWNDAVTNWTNMGGSANGAWGDQFAVFFNGTGDVTVEGERRVTGLQFAADGYRLVAGTDGALNLSGETSRVRVDAGRAATLALPVTAGGNMVKDGAGTLTLTDAVGITGYLDVADGVVRAEAGANMDVGGALVIAPIHGFSGETVVSGTGARIASQFSNVGFAGEGHLLVSAGGHMEMRENSLIGWGVESVGAATVTGAGSRWTSGGYLAVGNSGGATLTVADGGVVESLGSATSGSGGSRIARYAGSTGTARVTGAGSLWSTGDQLIVGYGGTGTLRLDDGGAVEARRIDIALEAGSEGHLILGGEGAAAGAVRADEIAFGA